MTKEEFENKLQEIMEYMRKNYHPHTTIIMNCVACEIVEGMQAIQNEHFKNQGELNGERN